MRRGFPPRTINRAVRVLDSDKEARPVRRTVQGPQFRSPRDAKISVKCAGGPSSTVDAQRLGEGGTTMAGGSAFPFPYSELKVYKVKPEDMKPTYVETRGVTLDIAVL